MVRVTLPPAPPLALTLAIESPPVRLPMVTRSRLPTFSRTLTSPARPEFAVARSPPAPPLPPTAVPLTRLRPSPVLPEVAIAEELAPLFASETDDPVAVASPVGPEFPVSPDCVGVDELAAGAAAAVVGGAGGAVVVVVPGAASAAGPRSRMAAAATPVAPARQAAPATRTLLPLVMLIPCLDSAFEQVPDYEAHRAPRHKVVRFLARAPGPSKLCRPKFPGDFFSIAGPGPGPTGGSADARSDPPGRPS